MLIITIDTSMPPGNTVLGVIGCAQIAPVTDYRLIQTGLKGRTVETELQGYSRWTEPAVGLLARMLSRVEGDVIEHPFSEQFCCKLHIGRCLENGRVIEQIDGRIGGGMLYLDVSDSLSRRAVKAPVRGAYRSLNALVEHATRLAAWDADHEPPIPESLTTVPIRQDPGDGYAYVLEADIPPHPRAHIADRKVGGTQPKPGAYFAHEWLAFIGAY